LGKPREDGPVGSIPDSDAAVGERSIPAEERAVLGSHTQRLIPKHIPLHHESQQNKPPVQTSSIAIDGDFIIQVRTHMIVFTQLL